MIELTIKEVSTMYNISADTLRYYEKIGLIDPVKRNENGIRDYKEIDLKRIQFLKCMRLSGLSIDMLLQYIELLHQGEHTIPQRKEILMKQREVILLKMKELQDYYAIQEQGDPFQRTQEEIEAELFESLGIPKE